jgi:dTDP-4-amino-4,6-dideoxygalactose transaminase
MPSPPEKLDDLALFGADPAFAEPRHVGRPNIGDRARLLSLIEGALDRRWLTNDGPLVDEFERQAAEIFGTAHCVAVSSATVGLQLAARALDLTGQVIVPSFTFIGTAHALSWMGLEPVFCEIDEATHTLDPAAVEPAITAATSAILGVHLWGRPCAVDELADVARRHDLKLFFDAAHALGCSYAGQPVAGFGEAAVFSFHATKIASSAEGGGIATNDDHLARRLRLMRNFGFAGYDRTAELGTNAKLSELCAAVGISSLESLDTFVEANRRNHERYRRELDGMPGVRLLPSAEGERQNHQYVVVEVEGESPERHRDDIVVALHAENILARRYFSPGCHRLEPYVASAQSLPRTERVAARVITLPTGTSISEEDVSVICSVLRVAAGNTAELRRRLADAPPGSVQRRLSSSSAQVLST